MLIDCHAIWGYLLGKMQIHILQRIKTIIFFIYIKKKLGKYFYAGEMDKIKFIQNIMGSQDYISMRKKNKKNYFSTKKLLKKLESKIKKFAKLFNNINERKVPVFIPERKFLIWGAILSCIPDLDVLISPFFGGHHSFHRTITHSLIGEKKNKI
jgi:hypothetical protein